MVDVSWMVDIPFKVSHHDGLYRKQDHLCFPLPLGLDVLLND